jgi:hypothetical protein
MIRLANVHRHRRRPAAAGPQPWCQAKCRIRFVVEVAATGAASRFNMGLVIATGLSIGTVFTLFVVPAVYMLIASDRRPAADRTTALAPAAGG